MLRNIQERKIVKIGKSRQVAIPKNIYNTIGFKEGGYVEITTKGNTLVLSPRALVDREIAEAIEDLRAGRVHGPFDTAEEAMRALIKKN